MASISVVINTLNEEKNLPRALASVKSFADEIVVVDMESTDKTVEIAKKAGAKVYTHKPTGYVEPARNFAISKATGDWILILDADEGISPSLAKGLAKIINSSDETNYYRIPRKNIIFGKWIKHSRWWPDYNIRLFKRGFVTWGNEIHSIPVTKGNGADLDADEENVIVHHNYTSISEYLQRMLRYTDIQSKDLIGKKYVFTWTDLIRKPVGEFLSRFFAGEGYKDGVHGLVLSLFQSFSEALVLIKVWEAQKFPDSKLEPHQIDKEFDRLGFEVDHWLQQSRMRKYGLSQKFLRKLLKK